MVLFRNLPPASPERERPACHARHERAGGGQAASICGIVCAAYDLYASAQFLDFAKNCSFLNWKLELIPMKLNPPLKDYPDRLEIPLSFSADFFHISALALVKYSELRFVTDVPAVASVSSSGGRGKFPIPAMGNGTTS